MKTRTKILLALLLIAFGFVGRMLPHAWNFTPLIAISLFAGAYLGHRYVIAIPIITMLLSDIFLGFYNVGVMLTVYTSIILAGLIGTYLSSQKNLGRLTLATLSSSTLFFLTTNTAVWAFGTMYEKSLTGLLASYTAGIPFFRNMIVGDIWFTLVLFGSYELAVLLYKRINTKKTPETVNL